MNGVRHFICVACAFAATLACAAPAPELKTLATDPAPDALLARQQPFYVRFELKSAAPATVSASGLYKGAPVIDDGGTGAPALLPAGGGIGAVSFFYWGEKPTRIDEVRLRINDKVSGAQLGEYAFPVALTWLTDDPPPREPAAWVREWQQAQLAPGRRTAGQAGPATEQLPDPGMWLALAAGAALLAIAIAWWRRRAHAVSADDNAGR
jgi:hypothetical protein